MKLIPAALPTMMFGTELISVSSPPMLVSNPSISRNPSSLSVRLSLPSDTAVSDPTMIMAVTLLSTAEKTTVISPYSHSNRRGSPPEALVSLIAIHVNRPDLEVTSTKRLAPRMIAITASANGG